MSRFMKKKWFLVLMLIISSQALAKTQFYAHRGGRALWPENTLCAFSNALKTKADFIDMDVQLSKDGQFVVTHNSGLALDLTRDKQLQWIEKKTPIRHLTVKQLRQFEVGQIKPNTAYAKEFSTQQVMNGCHIHSLSEAIDHIKKLDNRNVGFQIELKVPTKLINDPMIPKLYANKISKLLKQKDIVQRSEIQSFDFRVLAEIAKINPDIKLAFLTEKQQGNSKLFEQIKSLNGLYWEPSAEDVTVDGVKMAHAAGLKVVVWGLPTSPEVELKTMRELIQAQVDGIITDNPSLISRI